MSPQPQSNPKSKAPGSLPLLPVRDVVVFPTMVLPLAVGREKSIRALEESMATHHLVFVTTQKKVQVDDPQEDDLFLVGTVCEVLQMAKMPDGTFKILVEGVQRAVLQELRTVPDKNYSEAKLHRVEEPVEESKEVLALSRQINSLFDQYVKLTRRVPMEVAASVQSIDEPGHLSDAVASHLFLKTADKQNLLEILPVRLRMEKVIESLTAEIEILNLEKRIQARVRSQIEKSQKEYYLTEQMKAIQKELRQKDDFVKEVQDIYEKVKEAKMTDEAREVARKECERLEKMTPFSPEATVIRTYLDWLIQLPWAVKTKDNLDMVLCEKILNGEHYGLEKAKERIVEYLAVLKLVKKMKGPILCFVGPPGVGKTSLARSIANALGRNFVRISLGGVRDEAEIRGHRRTYIGSLPGRIMQSLRKSKSKNPVFLLDEIDKMGSDWRGDPSAALLEVLDPEQNSNFTDHYLDVGFDLSEVLFITTANSLYNIPVSLHDRLEVVRFPGYMDSEKIAITRNFLIPKQLKEHGLESQQLEMDDSVLKKILTDYTQEAGVRNVERQIAKICRKVAKKSASAGSPASIHLKQSQLQEYLGIPEFYKDSRVTNGVGVATGLAWTEHGGELLAIEVNAMKGKGKLLLTGKLGEVMRESAQAALSYVRAQSKKFKIQNGFFQETDFHVHVPEGAVPKDGPSAGIAIGTAVASVCSGRAVKKYIAMTGEITLRGQVLPIGGFKEKVIAAHREGIKTVLYPEGNRKDLTEIPPEILKDVKLVSVKQMEDVLHQALE
ncbi:MAG: endopeptidase La [Elusimicrobia bacterium]|nr:endopeptidase La [Elusimicrobiota bacterium]